MVPIVDHGTWQLVPADEGGHPPGPEQLWNESWYFDFASADGSIPLGREDEGRWARIWLDLGAGERVVLRASRARASVPLLPFH